MGEPDWSDPNAWNTATSQDFIQHEITEEAMEYSWEVAVEQAQASGINMLTSPTWQLYLNDESARRDFLEKLRQQINEHNAEIIASLDGYQQLDAFDPTPAPEFLNQKLKAPKTSMVPQPSSTSKRH